MAVDLFTFGVKYRLDVSDVEGCLWRIDIEEKDYVGSVTNFIGDGTAFEITWENNEDYDKSIIGSLARINIMAKPVADVGSPDFADLFTTDENKFRVKIYYDETFAPLKDNFSLYWQGFIVQDDYVEQVIADPYRVQVVATENFGKLKRFPFNNNDPSKHEEVFTPSQILYDGLVKIGLAIDAIDLSGYHRDNVSSTLIDRTEPYSNEVIIPSNALRKGDAFNDMYSYYEAIESYLLSINSFMVQAYGDLYIVSKASYDSVINANFGWEAFEMTFGASSFSHGRAFLGKFPQTDLDIPVDFKVLDKSLTRIRKSATQKTINEYNIENKNVFFNGSFELDEDANSNTIGWYRGFGAQGVNTPVPFSFVTNQSSGTGNRSMRVSLQNPSTNVPPFESGSELTRNSTYTYLRAESTFTTDSAGVVVNTYNSFIPYAQNHSSGEAYELQGKLSFKVYVPSGVSPTPVNFRYSFELGEISGIKSNEYFDFDNNVFSGAHVYGTEVIEEQGVWVDVSKTIPITIDQTVPLGGRNVIFRVHVCTPESGLPSGSIRVDDVSFVLGQPEGNEDALTVGNNVFSVETEETDQSLGDEVNTKSSLYGVTNFNQINFFFSDLFERTDLLTTLVDGQYFTNGVREIRDVRWYYDKDPETTVPYTPRQLALQKYVDEHRRDETKTTQSFIQGTLKNYTNQNGGSYKPITPIDVLQMSFRSGAYDSTYYLISRLSINPRLNTINFTARNIVETQGSYVNP